MNKSKYSEYLGKLVIQDKVAKSSSSEGSIAVNQLVGEGELNYRCA